jgi:DNA-binding response OmpR family regulator
MVVEDELLVALMIEEVLLEQGCQIIGPFTNLADALRAARDETMELAVLDVNLCGERVYPVAELLESRGIPFLLLSGYGRDAAPPDRPNWVSCSKPFRGHELTHALVQLTAAKATEPSKTTDPLV